MSRPFRYTFILTLVAIATALAAAGGWKYARASAPVSGPIVVISIDALRADHLPAYGYTAVKTPAIDALAADGVVFERAYSHSPQTLPAHVALLSGRLPFDTGVRDDIGFTVKAGERLLPQMLRDRGFTTAGVVSSYLLRKETGIAQGFDFFDGDLPAASPETGDAPVQRDGLASEAVAERWLNGAGTSRAFLFLHLNEPHRPYALPARFASYAPYDGEIAYADEIVGRLVKYLKSHQLYDRSTIVLLSDHGEGLGDHGEQGHGLFVYDEAIHVPLIVKQEGNAGGGRRVSDVVQHVDIAPTILDLVKAPTAGQLRGRSLKPLLDGTGRPQPVQVYAESLYGRYRFGWSELAALVDDRYEYIRAPREELYDLRRDRRERTNVAAERDRDRQAMRQAVDRLTANIALAAPAQVAQDVRDRAAALGSVGAPGVAPAAPVEAQADPKDKAAILERYRAASDRAVERRWPEAIAALQELVRDEPAMADAWMQLAALATRMERHELALDAYRHSTELMPNDPAPYLGAAAALRRLRRLAEAREQASLAASMAPERDARSRGLAHELLARIAAQQRDASAAREEARLAEEADPSRPVAAFVDGRIRYDDGEYEGALEAFEAAASAKKPVDPPIAELHFYAADALARLDRTVEAETEYNQELALFPHNTRARAALATLLQSAGRSDEAAAVLRTMVAVTPTPDTYALASRLLAAFGDRPEAEALRAEARRTFPDGSRIVSRARQP